MRAIYYIVWHRIMFELDNCRCIQANGFFTTGHHTVCTKFVLPIGSIIIYTNWHVFNMIILYYVILFGKSLIGSVDFVRVLIYHHIIIISTYMFESLQK